jgi:hypothetical protein
MSGRLAVACDLGYRSGLLAPFLVSGCRASPCCRTMFPFLHSPPLPLSWRVSRKVQQIVPLYKSTYPSSPSVSRRPICPEEKGLRKGRRWESDIRMGGSSSEDSIPCPAPSFFGCTEAPTFLMYTNPFFSSFRIWKCMAGGNFTN